MSIHILRLKEKCKKLLEAIVKRKKVLIIIASVALTIVLAFIIGTSIKQAYLFRQTSEQFEGKYYVWKHGDTWVEFFAFKDGKFAHEEISSYSGEQGDITAFGSYQIKASLLERNFAVWQNGVSQIHLFLNESGKIEFPSYMKSDIYQIKFNDIEDYRKDALCGTHDYKEIVISEATCSKSGETQKTCQKCGKTEIISTTKDHNYVNGVCNKCGQKKPRQKTSLSANTWYTHTQISSLKVQNISVTQAYMRNNGKGVFVTGYYFCANCKCLAETLSMRAPEFGYDVTQIYICDLCDHATTVRLHLE